MASRWNGNPVLNQSFGWKTPRQLVEGAGCGLRRCAGVFDETISAQEQYGVTPEAERARAGTGKQRIYRDPQSRREERGIGDLGATPEDVAALQQFRFANNQARALSVAGQWQEANAQYQLALGLSGNVYVQSQGAGELDFTAAILRGDPDAVAQYSAQAGLTQTAQENQPSRTDILIGNLPQTPILSLATGGVVRSGPSAGTTLDYTAAVMRKTGLLTSPPGSGSETRAQENVDKAASGALGAALKKAAQFASDNWWKLALGYVIWKKL